MKNLKLYEIIELLETPGNSVLIELMQPYFKSLRTYYRENSTKFKPELILMVTSVTNATSYARIEPVDEFNEALEEYINTMDLETEEERENERETINFNSRMLNEFINDEKKDPYNDKKLTTLKNNLETAIQDIYNYGEDNNLNYSKINEIIDTIVKELKNQ